MTVREDGVVAAYPRGTPEAVAAALEPGEALVAATAADNRSDGEDALAFLGGQAAVSLGRRLSGRERPDPTPRWGWAGMIPPGPLLVAATDRRVLVFPRRGRDVAHPPLVFLPEHVVSVDRGAVSSSLYVLLADRSSVTLGLPSSNHAPHVVRAVRGLGTRPPAAPPGSAGVAW